MRSTEFEGKSYEDAVQRAVTSLDVQADELTIDILPERKFLLLFGRKKVRIRASLNNAVEDDVFNRLDKWMDQSAITNSSSEKAGMFLTGKAWVKSNELIFSADDFHQPLITIPDQVSMSVNQIQVFGTISLYEKDSIRFDLSTVKRDSQWSVQINKSTQEVFLKISPGKYLVPFIEDHQPAEHVKISVGYFDQPDNEVTENMIYDKLNDMNVVFGIDDEIIKHACHTHEKGEFLIAKGELAVDGEDGALDMHLELDQESLMKEDNEGNIDFRDSLKIPGIREGEELGRIIEATDGVDGMSVTGDILKSSDGLPISIKSSKDIEIDENQMIRALVPGRPQIEKSGNVYRIVIAPKYTHQGDLTPKDGHIRFVGDVEIAGFVTDGMKISAEGTIFIHKGAFYGIIQARESVIVGQNVISSTVVAGKNSVILKALGYRLNAFMIDLEAFVKDLNQLRHVEEFQAYFHDQAKVGSLVQRVKETRFPDIEKNGEELAAFVYANRERLEPVWMAFIQSLERHFLSFRLQKFFSLEALQDIYDQGVELLAICEAPGAQQADINLKYATNSTLEASHDIRVIGKGMVNTSVIAGGHLTCEGKTIGGKLEAFSMDLHTVGSPYGVRTFLKADSEGFVRASLVFPDVILRIGDRQHFFTREESMINARLDDQGDLLFF